MRLIDLLLSDNPRELMESELLTSLPLPADDLVPDKQVPTGGLSDQLATLGELLLADPSVPVSRTSDSVSSTIANLLKSESLCSVTSSDYVPDRSGADCGSFTLEQLLRNDNSWTTVSPVKILSEPKANGGVPSTLAQLLQSNSKLNSYVNLSSQSQATVAPSPVKQASSQDKCQMTDIHQSQLMQDEDLRISASCDLFGSQQVHLNTNFGVTLTDDEIDIEGFSLLNNEDTMGLFGEGIEAQDVASLLEQFEEAECSLPASPQIPSHHDPVPDSPQLAVPDTLSPTSSVPSSQSPLLSAPSSSSYLQSHLSNLPDSLSTSLNNCVSTSLSPTMTPPPCKREITQQNTSPLSCRSNIQQSRSLLDSDSEVVKLLKAKHPAVASLNKSVKPPVAAPSPEVIRKIKASNKRKSAIMLTNAVPAKAERGRAVEIPNFTSKKLQKIMRQGAGERLAQALEGVSTPSIDGSVSATSTPQASNHTTPACSDSEVSRSSTPERRVKKITLLQYKKRREQMKQDPNYIEVNKNFFESIVDHDYCQNVPRAVSNVKASQQVWGKKYHEEDSAAAPENADSESVLKSLLLNQNLTEEMKKQAVKDREFTMKNMSRNASTSRQRRETITDVIDMDIDSDHDEEPTKKSPTKTKTPDSSKCPRSNSKTHCNRTTRESRVKVNKPNFKTKRHYRTRSACPNGDGDSNVYFDKLPPYYTTLAVERANGGLTKSNSSAQLMDTTLPDRDRDPSPERDPVYDKVPDYYSCFTNSTKYDQQSNDPLCINNEASQSKADWEMSRSNSGSSYSSIDMRSRSCSTSSSSSSSSRSRSRGRNRRRTRPGRGRSCSTSSGSPSRGKSYSYSRSRSRSYSRSHTRHFRRRCNRSYSRSDSESSSGSSSSRSRSRTSRSRDRHMRSRRTRRSHSRSWYQWKQEQRQKRDHEKKRDQEKKQQIDERRIVYVGGIPLGFTRRELRKKFERFGDIEEVSVHFREHGGDNYGFVTFSYACDAFSAIEKGKTLTDCMKFDLCFGGRREFCKSDYADLDGNMEDEEEMGPVLPRRTDELDFDELLRQAQKNVKKKSEPQRASCEAH